MTKRERRIHAISQVGRELAVALAAREALDAAMGAESENELVHRPMGPRGRVLYGDAARAVARFLSRLPPNW